MKRSHVNDIIAKSDAFMKSFGFTLPPFAYWSPEQLKARVASDSPTIFDFPADLEGVDEAFITGTTREVTPVVAVSGRNIGDGKPGRITQQLLTKFREKIEMVEV